MLRLDLDVDLGTRERGAALDARHLLRHQRGALARRRDGVPLYQAAADACEYMYM